MQSTEKAILFFRNVVSATAARKLKWQETANAGVFVAPMAGKYTVKMYKIHPRLLSMYPVLNLLEGDELLLDIIAEPTGLQPEELVSLFESIQHQVYRIDEKNQSIDNAIDILRKL